MTDNECIRRWDMLQFSSVRFLSLFDDNAGEMCFLPLSFHDLPSLRVPFPVCLFAMKNPRVTHQGPTTRFKNSQTLIPFLKFPPFQLFLLEIKKDATTNVFLINGETFYYAMKLDTPRQRSFLLRTKRKPHEQHFICNCVFKIACFLLNILIS